MDTCVCYTHLPVHCCRMSRPSVGSSNLPPSTCPSAIPTAIPSTTTTRSTATNRTLKRGETATWQISTVDERTYSTEEREEFVNPTKRILKKTPLESEYYLQQKKILEQKIQKKFQTLIEKKFGSVENLLSTVSLLLLQILEWRRTERKERHGIMFTLASHSLLTPNPSLLPSFSSSRS